MATTKKQTKKTTAAKPKVDALKALKARYPHVRSVSETGTKGNPTRVVVRCTEAGCSEERDVATQDAFQVVRCSVHQREAAKARRRKTPAKTASPKPRKRTKRSTSRKRATATA